MYQNQYTALLSISFRSDWPPLGLLASYRSDPPRSGLSNLFRSDLPSNHEKTDKEPVDKFLWRDIHCCIVIKDSSPKQASLCKHTWKIVVYMPMTGAERLGPDVWPKTPNQGTGTEEIILTTWYKEVIKRSGINSQQYHLPILSAKEARYVSYTNSN